MRYSTLNKNLRKDGGNAQLHHRMYRGNRDRGGWRGRPETRAETRWRGLFDGGRAALIALRSVNYKAGSSRARSETACQVGESQRICDQFLSSGMNSKAAETSGHKCDSRVTEKFR